MKKYALGAILIAASGICAADFNTGVEAYNKGDYTKALKEWLAVAQQKETAAVTANFDWHSSFVKNTVDAQYALGALYWQGKGIPQDYKTAEKWLRLAAHSGHSDAQLKLAYLYAWGLTGKQDYVQSKMWLEKAAEQNNANAEYNLGVMYQQGLGVKADKKLAKQWLTRAKQHGDPSASDLLANLDKPSNSIATEPKQVENIMSNPYTSTTAPPPPLLSKSDADADSIVITDTKPAAKATPVVAESESTKKAVSAAAVTKAVSTKPNKIDSKDAPSADIESESTKKAVVEAAPPTKLDKNAPSPDKAGSYTVQLLSSRNKTDIERLKAQWQDGVKALSIGEKDKNGQLLFRLLYGNFASESEAKQAISQLPAALQKQKPWIFKNKP